MSDDKKHVCGRHFVSGQGIVTICGDAPAPAVFHHTTAGEMATMSVGIEDPKGEVRSVTYKGKEIWPSEDPRFEVSIGPAQAAMELEPCNCTCPQCDHWLNTTTREDDIAAARADGVDITSLSKPE